MNINVAHQMLKIALSQFSKVKLGAYPTPLHELPHLSHLCGVKIYMKREDLSGPTLTLSGNKTRMLEYRLAKALEQGADIVIGGFDLQSNHARQLAAAARMLGLKVKLVLRKGRWKDISLQGNFLIDVLLGAEVKIVNANPDTHAQLVFDEADRLRKKGHRVYITAYDDEVLSTIAFVECGLELRDQLEQLGVRPQYIYVASEGATQAGLILCAKYLGTNWTVVGINPIDWINARSRIAELANKAAATLGLNVEIEEQEVINLDGYIGRGYGEPTLQAIEAIRLLAKTEGILLDPIYTGKAMAAMLDHIRIGKIKKDETALFIHTGGLPALFCYEEWFKAKTFDCSVLP